MPLGCGLLIFATGSQPEVGRKPVILGVATKPPVSKFGSPLRSLREDLIRMSWGRLNGCYRLLNKLEGNILMKGIAHRIDEDTTWLPPRERSRYDAFVNAYYAVKMRTAVKSPVLILPHRFEAFCPEGRVAVATAFGDGTAAAHEIPRSFSPLYELYSTRARIWTDWMACCETH